MIFELFLGVTLIVIIILASSLMLLRVRLTREVFGTFTPPPHESMIKDASKMMAGDERRAKRSREEASAEIASVETSINAELGIRHPTKTFAEGRDYTLWVDLGGPGFASTSLGPGEGESREGFEFKAGEAAPVVEIAVSSTAFNFDTSQQQVTLDLRKVVSVPFIFSPKEESLGERQIMVRITYKGREVKAATVKVLVEKYVIDGLSYVYVKRLRDLSTLLSAVSGIITVVLGLFGL